MILPQITKTQQLVRVRSNCRPSKPGTIKPNNDDVVPPSKPNTTEIFGITRAKPRAVPANRSVTAKC